MQGVSEIGYYGESDESICIFLIVKAQRYCRFTVDGLIRTVQREAQNIDFPKIKHKMQFD